MDIGNSSDPVLHLYGITTQDFFKPPMIQRIELSKRDEGLRFDSVTQIQPGKITQRLFARHEHSLCRFGVNGLWHPDEPQFARGGQAIRFTVMASVGEASNPDWRLSNQMVVEQRVKTRDVGGRIDLRHEVFWSHSLDWTVSSMRIARNKASSHQTTELGIQCVQSGPGGVGKFGDRKDYLSVRGTLFGEKVLPV